MSRRGRGSSVIFKLTTLIAAFFAGEAFAQSRAGSIAQIHGTARVERSGRTLAASAALAIIIGDKIETARRSDLTLRLVNGGELTLSESTSIVIDPSVAGLSASDSAIALFTGKLRSIVTRSAGAPQNFEVHTPNAVVAVRGTDFETEFIEGKPCPGFPQCLRYTDVGVYKGVVEVRNPTSSGPARVLVTAGYETTVPCELPPAPPGPLGMGDLTAPGYH